MVKKKKITWKAKGKDIATYRNMLNLTQEDLVQKAVKKYKLKIGLRHLQNAEAGKEIGIDTLTNLAYFFDRESIDVAFEPDSQITINSIAEDPNKKTTLDLPKITNNINLKSFAANIKKERTFKTESTYLHRIDFHDQVTQAIKKSKKRKIFYPFNPDLKEVSIIKKTLTDISNIHKSIFGTMDFDSMGHEYDTDYYTEVDKEIQSLTKMSDFGESIKELKKNNLNLYAGNFDFNYITSRAADPMALEEDHGPGGGFGYRGEFKATINSDNYAIFSFQKNNITSFTFSYDNEWFKEKLEKIIEIDPSKANDIDYEAHAIIMDHYKNNYGYRDKFQKVKANLTKTNLSELFTDEEREKLEEDILKKREEEEAEAEADHYAQLHNDAMKGK